MQGTRDYTTHMVGSPGSQSPFLLLSKSHLISISDGRDKRPLGPLGLGVPAVVAPTRAGAAEAMLGLGDNLGVDMGVINAGGCGMGSGGGWCGGCSP